MTGDMHYVESRGSSVCVPIDRRTNSTGKFTSILIKFTVISENTGTCRTGMFTQSKFSKDIFENTRLLMGVC